MTSAKKPGKREKKRRSREKSYPPGVLVLLDRIADIDCGRLPDAPCFFEPLCVPCTARKLLGLPALEEPKGPFLIYTTTENGAGDTLLWWKPAQAGYTTRLEKAGRYTYEEAKKIVGVRGQEVAVPLQDALESSERVVPIGKLKVDAEPKT